MAKSKAKQMEIVFEEKKVEPVVELEEVEGLDEIEETKDPIVEIEVKKDEEMKTTSQSKKPQTDMIDLAKVLGKTESGMKAEFYVYQIKELMQRVGKIFDTKKVTSADVIESHETLKKFGVSEILVSPIYASECAKAEKKNPTAEVKFGTIIDYPFGESTFKAKMMDVRNSLKSGFNSITVTFPTSAIYLGKANSEKSNVIKLAKKCKIPFGVALSPDIPIDEMKKLLKAFGNSKISYVTLLLDKLDSVSMFDYFTEIAAYKGKLKVYAYTSIASVKDLSALIELSADRVYTPHVEAIGRELLEKFDVEL